MAVNRKHGDVYGGEHAVGAVRRGGVRRSRFVAMAALAAAGVALSSCGLQSSAAFVKEPGPGSLEEVEGAEGQEVVVTSKNFTEQQIVGKIAVLTAKASGFKVKDLTNVPGSVPARKLMEQHKADVMFDYTGTVWLSYLGGEEGIPDPQKQWQAVADADRKNSIAWGKPGKLNNTYAIAYRSNAAEKLGNPKNFSDVAKLPVEERTFCVEAEFNSRGDGFKPMLELYEMDYGKGDGVPASNVSVMDTGAVYEATARGTCNFGEVFATDGRIKSLGLTVLEDDRKFFPSYEIAPLYNAEFIEKYPQLEENYEKITAKMNNETFQELNLKVDVEGQDPSDVAYDWMVSEGFISEK